MSIPSTTKVNSIASKYKARAAGKAYRRADPKHGGGGKALDRKLVLDYNAAAQKADTGYYRRGDSGSIVIQIRVDSAHQKINAPVGNAQGPNAHRHQKRGAYSQKCMRPDAGLLAAKLPFKTDTKREQRRGDRRDKHEDQNPVAVERINEVKKPFIHIDISEYDCKRILPYYGAGCQLKTSFVII